MPHFVHAPSFGERLGGFLKEHVRVGLLGIAAMVTLAVSIVAGTVLALSDHVHGFWRSFYVTVLTVVGSSDVDPSRPGIAQAAQIVLAVSGVVCRRVNFYGLSPPRLQIEAIGADGAVVAKSYAFLAALSRRADQRCGDYATLLKPQDRPVTRVRVCAARHGDCPAHEP